MSFMLLGILNAQASGGAAGAFDLLETTTLTSSASSVTFSGLDAYSDYKHLQIRATVRTGRSLFVDDMTVNMNGDSSSSYAFHRLVGSGSSVSSNAATSQTRISEITVIGNAGLSNSFATVVMDILDYASTSKNTTTRTLFGTNDSSQPFYRIGMHSGLYANTTAITTISFSQNSLTSFVAGSRFSLYGVK